MTPDKNEYFFPVATECFARALETLKTNKVAVMGHKRPDGDCIGSIVAVVRLLRALGVDAVGVDQDPVPGNLRTFVGDTPLLRAEAFEPDGHIAVTVDCADHERIGDRLFSFFPGVALNIDHHISNKDYGRENIVVGDSSATAEILAGIFLDLELPLDEIAAQALYVGIATDTGQFRFPSTTPATFELVRRLCEKGARPADAALELYERESFARIQLLQSFLRTLRLEFDSRVCAGFIEDGVYETTGASIDDSEGLVDYARAIDGVAIGVMVEERKGALKISLRAKDPFYRVDQIARQFNGGGHACAAGLNMENSSINAFYPELLQAIGAHLETLGLPEAAAAAKS